MKTVMFIGAGRHQRRAILLREWQGLSYREIAEELDTTEAAIETLLFRARRSLARKLDRSRGRVWGGLNLGSLVAYGKSLLGGAALKLAAATVVVAAGASLAAPSLRHHVTGGSSLAPVTAAALGAAPASLQAPALPPLPSQTRSGASAAHVEHATASARGRTATPARSSAPTSQPSGTLPGAVPAPVPAGIPGPAPVAVPLPPPVPVQVGVPPLPPLPVEVPPVPAIVLPVTLPSLPSVPPLPGLPKLP